MTLHRAPGETLHKEILHNLYSPAGKNSLGIERSPDNKRIWLSITLGENSSFTWLELSKKSAKAKVQELVDAISKLDD